MTEKYIQANGIQLAYDEFGNPSDPALLLIMGLGTQMIAWTEPFCQNLADSGFRVIRFDNRDIGLSQKMDNAKVPNLPMLAILSRLGFPVKAPYTLNDMAEDAIGLLDALGIEAAHIVGASMGGMIGQLVAGNYPNRALTLTSIMSTSGAKSLPMASRKVMKQLTRRSRSNPDEYIEYSVDTLRMIGSPGYRTNDEKLRQKVTRSYKRSYYPAGFARQASAIVASGDRVSVLKKMQVPTLVIHGTEDVLAPVEGGIDTARHVPSSKLELIEGMGHDLPEQLYDRLIGLISSHAKEAA